MSSVETIARAGDVTITDVTIITASGFLQTITPQVLGIEIFEDLFGDFITGQIIVRDSQHLIELMPFIGEEMVRLNIVTPSLGDEYAISGEFQVYKIDNKEQVSGRGELYVIHFISKEAIVDMNQRVPKAFEGNPSKMVADIVKDTKWGLGSPKTVFVEDTNNTFKYVSNYWTPLQNIQYISERATSAINSSPTFVFFENKKGFNFIAVESLYLNTELTQRFVVDNYTADIQPSGGSYRNLERDYQRVLEISAPTLFDYVKRVKSGMYGSEVISYDILTHQYSHYSYQPNFIDSKHLNEQPLWTGNAPASPKSVLIDGRKYYNNFDGYSDVTNTAVIQKRKSLMAQAEGSKVNITVFGRTDYTVGQKILLEVPKPSQIKADDTDWKDKIMTGVYMITALCHSIDRSKHLCMLELSKDSYVTQQ